MPVGALIVHSLVMIVFCLSASRLRPRAPEAQSGRRAGGAGLDLKSRIRQVLRVRCPVAGDA